MSLHTHTNKNFTNLDFVLYGLVRFYPKWMY